MSMPEIKDLEQLLRPHLDKTKTIVATKVSRLTAPGENYGSEMLKVDLTLEDETNGDREDLSLVAKLTPESEFFRIMFNVQVSFKLEVAFYDTVVPSWQEFQRRHGVTEVIDNFARFYGSRENLGNPGGLVDKDAVLVLENLKVRGYTNVDRLVGFNLPTTIHLLSVIARFHAVPLALKLRDIETFNRKVKPFFACNHAPAPRPPINQALSRVLEALEAKESCRHLIPKLAKTVEQSSVVPIDNFREPFSTISHRDLWVNNLMVKFEAGEPVDSKIVDFQMYSYDTPTIDLVFFLLSSVEIKALMANLDLFLEHYHQVFTDTLKALGCDVEPFSYVKFMEEMAVGIQRELTHVCFMLCFVIHLDKPLEPPTDNFDAPPPLDLITIRNETLERIWWILEECDRRGWLNF